MANWWDHYLEGLVIQRPETPQSIISTMKDWHNGPKSALHRFAHGKPVSPRALIREITAVRVENRQPKEDARIRAMEIWAFRECELAEAAKAFREARRAFHDAANAAELDPYVTSRIATMEA